MNPLTSAIIVAAGRGTRMGPNVDKLFLELAGRPLVVHTWQRFDATAALDELILVVREGMQQAFHELATQFSFKKPFRLVPGGAERQESVWNGLLALSPAAEIVVIQDGARPCTAAELIVRTIDAARQTGAAVAAQRITDTIKESDDGALIARTLDRSRLWSVQTPQTFRVGVIRRALTMVREKGLSVTDDTAACELIHQPVTLVESLAPNPKATSPADLPLLEVLIGQAQADFVRPGPKLS
jgi:2-C-methyl-D-erythritol 4-phosphate cytidylyltransferase